MEDSKIVELYFERNTEAINQTSIKYGNRLIRLAEKMLGSREDAVECLNDTLLNAWNGIPPNRPKYLFGYLAKICRNIALNRIDWKNAEKRKAEIVELTEELAWCIPAYKDLAKSHEDLGLVLSEFLKELPYEKRMMFVRRYWYADSVKEIARMCKCSQSKVKTTLFRVREQLREYLEKEGIYI